MVNNRQEFVFYNLWERKRSLEIETVFPSWVGKEEVIAVLSPHDDDALLGAGYILQAAQYFGAEVYIVIACNGCGGYTTLEEKNSIVDIRKEETVKAYSRIGIPEDHIIRMDYPDFSLRPNIGWKMPWGETGTMGKMLKILRDLRTTRLLLPNPYCEHIDHEAAYFIGAWDGPQAGDPIMPDYGQPQAPIKSYFVYSVWSKFSPLHALAAGKDPDVSANIAIGVSQGVEERVALALSEYKSQAKIISELIKQRQERRVKDNLFIELYLSFEARPKFDFRPYVNLIRVIDETGA
ncbi:PIG-L deacetylase family protein [Candidatus Caldatribacterium saccharofermentans]|uniref:PIG-L deacetylase family protein n=1 Tax=Candidatus Caldatribacterium saccharofermentans TaxID=1454753 RepID=UPI003CFE5F2B